MNRYIFPVLIDDFPSVRMVYDMVDWFRSSGVTRTPNFIGFTFLSRPYKLDSYQRQIRFKDESKLNLDGCVAFFQYRNSATGVCSPFSGPFRYEEHREEVHVA